MIKGKTIWISLAIGCLIAVTQIFFEVLPQAINPLKVYNGFNVLPSSVFQYWMGMNRSSPFQETYITIFPILGMLPFALTYYQDRKSGYIKNILTRNKKINYALAKYFVTFISAGMVVIIPYAINLLISLCMLPALTPARNGTFSLSAGCMLQHVYYDSPFVYIMIYFFIIFVYAGAFATIALAATTIVDNVFILSLFPFLLWYGLKLLSQVLGSKYYVRTINPGELISMAHGINPQPISVIGVAMIVGIISAIIYFVSCFKTDIL